MSNVSSPMESDSVEVNDQLATTSNLSALLRKQKFYMNMIDSLEPASDLNPKEAKVQSEHLNQFYEKFISNQSEITTLVEDASFGDQVEISQKVEQKVRKIQTKLEEIISPIITIQTSASSVINENEHFNQTERPRVITEFLDSLLKKRKSLLEQIECIESKDGVGGAEAEILFESHDAFVENQSKIEAYINGLALDEQLQISGGILRELIALQIKLKKIVAPVPCVEAQAKSSESASSVPEGVSADDVEAQGASSISKNYAFLSGKFSMLSYMDFCMCKKILHCIDRRLHPLIDNNYLQFLKLRKVLEEDFREFPYFLRKVTEVSERVERAVEDYGLYCDGKIPRSNLDYIYSIVDAREKRLHNIQ